MGKRLNKQRVIDALHDTKGAVYLAAHRLKCSHTTVYKYLNDHEDVMAVKLYYDGEVTDIAELKLREAIIGGDAWAVKYLLSTKGKGRGYVERQEHTGAEGSKIIFEVIHGRDPLND